MAQTQSAASSLNQSYSAATALVFGSILTDEPKPGDIDVIVDAVALPADSSSM